MMLVVDGNNMVYRALHVFSLSYEGVDTSITYGVLRMLLALIRDHQPTSVVVCFDGGVPSFRRRLIPEYKAQRSKSGDIDWDDVWRQVDELIYIALPLHGIMTIRKPHVEADDLIAAVCACTDDTVVIVSSDADLLQCVSTGVSVHNPAREETYTLDNFEDLVGVPVDYYLLYKMFCGDSSDNIPGISGIGEKTAQKIITQVTETWPETKNPYSYTWLTAHIDELPLNSRQREGLLATGEKTWNALYEVLDLVDQDRTGSVLTVLRASWMPPQRARVLRYYASNGFLSLLEGGLHSAAMFLGRPEFTYAGRIPLPQVERTPVLEG